jgi:hypothetical protein
MRALRRSIGGLLLLAVAACGGDGAGPDLTGRWTSRPAPHNESAATVEWFGADTVERWHAAGNAATPLVELDLRRDRTFTLRGEVVVGAPHTAYATGTWRPARRGARLDVATTEDTTGLAAALVVPTDGTALVWARGPDEADAVLLFRDAP